MTEVRFMNKQEYLNGLNQQVGTLMFGSDLWDCLSLVDKKELRKRFKSQLANKRVYAVLIHTNKSKNFKNIRNMAIKYKYSAFCDWMFDGAYMEDGFWVYSNPVGDAIVVYTDIKPKTKKPKTEKPKTEELDEEITELRNIMSGKYDTEPRLPDGTEVEQDGKIYVVEHPLLIEKESYYKK